MRSLLVASIWYKLTMDRINLELLAGYGAAHGKFKDSNQRNSIDPFFRYELNNALSAFRIEGSLGFVFPKYERKAKAFKEIPSVTSSDPYDTLSTIVFYRPKKLSGCLIQFDLHVNDSLLGRVKNGFYHTFKTRGEQEIEVWAETEERVARKLYLEKGKTYYVRMGIGAGIVIGRPSFKLETYQRGSKALEKLIKVNR